MPSASAPSLSCVAAAWQAHQAELRAYLRHRVGEPESADDLLQDVFLKAMRQGPRFCAVDNRRAWLFQVARNALVDRLRSARSMEPLPPELPGDEPESASAVDLLAECVERVIAELPGADRDILSACDLGDQTQAAFAREHGLSLAAAKSRLLRARARLREQLTVSCRVRFGDDGRVCCHAGRDERPAPPEPASPR